MHRTSPQRLRVELGGLRLRDSAQNVLQRPAQEITDQGDCVAAERSGLEPPSPIFMQKSVRQLPVGLCDKLTNAASVVTVPRLKSLLDKVACEFANSSRSVGNHQQCRRSSDFNDGGTG